MTRWLIFVLLLAGCGGGTITPDEPWVAPDFSLIGLDGRVYTLSEQRGRWVILNFWATWCAPCTAEMPALQALADDYAGHVTLWGINQRETGTDAAAFAAAHGIRYPLLLNPPDQLLLDYVIVNLPQTFVVAPDGVIVARLFGEVDIPALRARLPEPSPIGTIDAHG